MRVGIADIYPAARIFFGPVRIHRQAWFGLSGAHGALPIADLRNALGPARTAANGCTSMAGGQVLPRAVP